MNLLRIAYLAQTTMSPTSGVAKKLAMQCDTWRDLGHTVGLFTFARRGQGGTPVNSAAWSHRLVEGPPLIASWRAVKALKAWEPDVLYFRAGFYWPAIKFAARRYPMIIEINGNDRHQIPQMMSAAMARLYLNRWERMIADASGVVGVSPDHVAVLPVAIRERAIVVGNPMRLDTYEPLPPNPQPRPRLVFLGTPGHPWHGLDKVLWLASARPQWDLELIGYTPADVAAPTGKVPPNVHCHGILAPSQYVSIIATCDVALSVLALHRKGFNWDSALKTREYLALGLPVILAYKEVGLQGRMPYLLQLPNEEGNVTASLPQIDAFVEKWRGRRIGQPAEVRAMDALITERRRLALMAKAVEERANRADH
jgi:hypothetical protein